MEYLGSFDRYRNSGGGGSGVNKIKDQMDDILENRAFFRRHVPQDGDSLYRFEGIMIRLYTHTDY